MSLGVSPIQNQIAAWLLRTTPTTGVRRVVSLAAAIASDIGNVRGENQDRAVIARGRDRQGEDYAVAAVADGVGGMRDGANCAALTIGTFLASVYEQAQMAPQSSEDWVRRAVNAANQSVLDKFQGNGGSTLVALVVRHGQNACWLSVGDSRVYSSSRKTLTQVSVDDTIAGQLGKSHDVAPEQSKLLQFIGMEGELEPHIAQFDGQPVDAVILTTDGVHNLAPAPHWIGQIVGNAPDPGVCVKRLVDLATWCGGPDNATAVMITLTTGQRSGQNLPYPCFEVWDAFGELQIITAGTAPEPLLTGESHQTPIAVHSTEAGPDAVTSPLRPAENDHSTKYERKASRNRRSRRVPKAKVDPAPKRDDDPNEAPGAKAPQLIMEFPTNDKG